MSQKAIPTISKAGINSLLCLTWYRFYKKEKRWILFITKMRCILISIEKWLKYLKIIR